MASQKMKSKRSSVAQVKTAVVGKVLAHYEEQTEDEAVAEDEAAFEESTQTVMEVPHELVPAIRELIAKHQA
jgi:type II secretory pathway component PulC